MWWLAVVALGGSAACIVVPKERTTVTVVERSVTGWRAPGAGDQCTRRVFEVRDITKFREAGVEFDLPPDPYIGLVFLVLEPIIFPISLAVTEAVIGDEKPRIVRIAVPVDVEHASCAAMGVVVAPAPPGLSPQQACLRARSAALLDAQQIEDVQERTRALQAAPSCGDVP